MSEFILFDSFMLKKSEILYAIKHEDEKKIEVMTRNSKNEEKKFTMNFHATYSMDDEYKI